MTFEPNPKLDQFLLTDEKIIANMIARADLNRDDVVLEVGAGRVIAFEVDPQFKPFLINLPRNVEIHYENAWDYIQLHGKFRKKKDLPSNFCTI